MKGTRGEPGGTETAWEAQKREEGDDMADGREGADGERLISGGRSDGCSV